MSDKVSDGTLDGLINLLKAGAGCNWHDALLALQELQALRAQQQAAGWRVKPLEWEEVSSRVFDSKGVCGLYRVRRYDDLWSAFMFGSGFRADRVTPEEAKAAAQSDYAARINSAIEPAPVVDGYMMVPAEPTEAMIKAAYAYHQGINLPGYAYRAMLAARPISASGRDGE